MRKQFLTVLMLAALGGLSAPTLVMAQAAAPAPQVPAQAPLPPGTIARNACGTALPPPSAEPPAGTTFIWTWEICFPSQGNESAIDPETYPYYVKFDDLISRPRDGIWSPWTEAAENVAKADFVTLMRDTTFLDDLRIERTDHTFPNGAVGVSLSYIGEERERVKIVDYRDGKGDPITLLKRSDIDEKLRERNISVRLDSFVDPAAIRRVETVLDQMMTDKGFANSKVTHTLTPVAGGPKLVNVTFVVSEGPKDKIARLDIVGNTAVSDGTIKKQIKENKPKRSFFMLGFLRGGGTWKETAFEEDAARVVDYYQGKGYAKARVGEPEVKVLRESKDGSERQVEVRIPITEGPRYRMGQLDFEGNKALTDETLRPVFKLKPGEWYSRKKLYDGFRTTQGIYGRGGYMEWTPAPMFKYSDDPDPIQQASTALVPPMLLAPEEKKTGAQPDPVVDVNVLFTEGPQYYVNRITFTGNTTTRDNVIRREMRLFEGGLFDTEALKFSVRRLNQLGYFSEIHGDDRDTKIDKNTAIPNTVDVTVKLAEQNRNQLTFGAGVSQYEGVFGQLAFQTSNFLGRGESLTVQMTAGDRSQNYQLAFTEPYLFDRNITGGFDVFKRSLNYIGYYTQKSSGGNLIFGFPVANFSRMFFNYAYEAVQIKDLNEALIDQSCLLRATGCGIITSLDPSLSSLTPTQREVLSRNPFVLESLLLGQGGSRTISRVTPSFVHNTVDNPIFPNEGKKVTATIDLAVLGGNTKYYKPRVEVIMFKRLWPRQSFGFRAATEYISAVGKVPCLGDAAQQCDRTLPIFERLTLGGEYSVRGFDLRAIGPTVPGSLAVLGGNKSLLFNAEYLISIASQVRIVLFYDAGQVRNVGQTFVWNEDITDLVVPSAPLLADALAFSSLVDPNAPGVTTQVVGQANAFKTSTGVELRFFMPVLNVPFRLIYAWNPSRAGVLDNQLQPQKGRVFKFSVGTTF